MFRRNTNLEQYLLRSAYNRVYASSLLSFDGFDHFEKLKSMNLQIIDSPFRTLIVTEPDIFYI